MEAKILQWENARDFHIQNAKSHESEATRADEILVELRQELEGMRVDDSDVAVTAGQIGGMSQVLENLGVDLECFTYLKKHYKMQTT